MIIFFLHATHTSDETALLHIGNEQMPMQQNHESEWSLMINEYQFNASEYSYSLQNGKGLTAESKLKRPIPKTINENIIEIYDDFLCAEESTFQTAPFTKVYFPHLPKKNIELNAGQWLLQVFMPTVEKQQCVAISGNNTILGQWNETKIRQLDFVGKGWWSLCLNPNDFFGNIEYKFVIYNKKTKRIDAWEDGNNRINSFISDKKTHVLNLKFRQKKQWKAAGVAIPVFSLRSKYSCGCGDFEDLKKMADWAQQVGLKIIQILPVNDTTNTKTDADSYPYSANSVYALNPIYLNIQSIGQLKDKELQKKFKIESNILNKKKELDYASVYALKTFFAKKLFEQNGYALFKSKEFIYFWNKNKFWLLPYAVFCCLADEYKTACFSCWPHYSIYQPEEVELYAKTHTKAVQLHYFIQYHLSKQLCEAREYLHQKGIALKGDLPIGIGAHSVDAWMYPELFFTDKQAGAPPDDFAKEGQNWGFPTYNWKAMQQNNLHWWKQRFINMSNYFDAYRIDHILGFFRIWEIPHEAVWGILGQFNPAMPLNINEIEAEGLQLGIERLTKPFITDLLLEKLLGEKKEQTIKTFFDKKTKDNYDFKAQFNSQRKLIDFFNSNNSIDKEIKKQLLKLYTEVLFLTDSYRPNHYHPQIAGHKTNSYSLLKKNEKEAFDRIHYNFYYVRHNDFWKEQAMMKLPALINTTDMLVCGEDLGMIPQCVPNVMNLLHILNLEVQRMPKNYGEQFVNPLKTNYLSVMTTGTHDTSTIRQWWRENKNLTSTYYHNYLKLQGEAPKECTPEIASIIIGHHLQANSMFTILPWQDYIAIESSLQLKNDQTERINNPSNTNHIWSYRIHLNLEQLTKASSFNLNLRRMLSYYGRI